MKRSIRQILFIMSNMIHITMIRVILLVQFIVIVVLQEYCGQSRQGLQWCHLFLQLNNDTDDDDTSEIYRDDHYRFVGDYCGGKQVFMNKR